MAREFFCAYHSLLETTKRLNDAEFGRLMRAAITYSADGQELELSGRELMAWDMVKWQIDRDVAEYAKKCEKQRQNVMKRWDTTVYDGKSGIPTYTNVYQPIPTDTKHTKEKEKEKEKETTSPISPPGNARSDAFETFWAAYPRKVAKDKARTAFGKVPKSEIPALMESLEKHKRSDQWTKDGGQFIPHPATWLNQKRWQGDAPPAGKGKRTEYAQHAVETVDFSHLMADLGGE